MATITNLNTLFEKVWNSGFRKEFENLIPRYCTIIEKILRIIYKKSKLGQLQLLQQSQENLISSEFFIIEDRLYFKLIDPVELTIIYSPYQLTNCVQDLGIFDVYVEKPVLFGNNSDKGGFLLYIFNGSLSQREDMESVNLPPTDI